MDRTVPAGAARLLDFIRDTEVGTEARSGYDVIYGHNQSKLPKAVTSMTIDEVLGQQASWSLRFGSSATGGYQFMRATLSGLKDELGLRGSQVLDANLQDRLGYHLALRRGYDRFVAGQIDRTEFAKRLAQEWASFPVLAAVRGASRQLARGQSYYAGDGLNKALVKPEQIEALLDEVLDLAQQTASAPIARPEPEVDLPVTQLPVPTPAPLPPVASPAPSGSATSKATGGAVGAAIPNVILLLLVKLGVIPGEAASDPETIILLTTLLTAAGGWIGAYLAPRNAPPAGAA